MQDVKNCTVKRSEVNTELPFEVAREDSCQVVRVILMRGIGGFRLTALA